MPSMPGSALPSVDLRPALRTIQGQPSQDREPIGMLARGLDGDLAGAADPSRAGGSPRRRRRRRPSPRGARPSRRTTSGGGAEGACRCPRCGPARRRSAWRGLLGAARMHAWRRRSHRPILAPGSWHARRARALTSRGLRAHDGARRADPRRREAAMPIDATIHIVTYVEVAAGLRGPGRGPRPPLARRDARPGRQRRRRGAPAPRARRPLRDRVGVGEPSRRPSRTRAPPRDVGSRRFAAPAEPARRARARRLLRAPRLGGSGHRRRSGC